MKRTAAFAFLLSLLLTANAFAQETRQQYMVALKSPFARGGLKALKQTIDDAVTLHNVVGFRSFDGFAADLNEEELALVSASPEVRWVEPVMERHAFAGAYDPQSVPYGVDLVKAPAAWQAARTGEVNVVVADTGVDYLHPDIAPMWAGGTSMISGTGGDPMDDNEHGSHVSGIIAASNNGYGVVGVAGVSGIRLWGVKVLNRWGNGTTVSIVSGIDWVISRKNAIGGRWVLNLSLGSSQQSSAEREAINRALAAGIIVVAASGNGSKPGIPAPVSYPAAYDGVVAVGAIDSASQIAEFSNQGPELDVVAPGVDVLSTLPAYLGSVTSDSTTYSAVQLDGSKRGTVSGPFVFCGLGKVGEFPSSVQGKIALIKRGEIKFAEKAKNALAAGATGVVIFNHDDSEMNWTLIDTQNDPSSVSYPWPVTLGISKADGEALQAKGTGALVLDTFMVRGYAKFNGTSMATPHVAGAAALLWAVAPTASPQQVVNALTSTAKDLGAPGQDSVFGLGLIDVNAAAQQLAPAAFSIPQPQGPTTGRRFGRRGR